jgi:hypothetical protein
VSRFSLRLLSPAAPQPLGGVLFSGLAISPCRSIYLGMSPTIKKSPNKVAKLRSWRVSIFRARAQYIGDVEAPDERAAEAAAVGQFGLTAEQRRRLVVRAEDDAD